MVSFRMYKAHILPHLIIHELVLGKGFHCLSGWPTDLRRRRWAWAGAPLKRLQSLKDWGKCQKAKKN